MDEEIFRMSKSAARAKSLKYMAEDRLTDIKHEKKPYKIVEQYYEVIKELITALMYSDGYKTLSHKSLILYLEKNYAANFGKDEFILMDDMRKLRNDILYYGKQVDRSFLINHEGKLKIIISKLINTVNKKLE